MMVRHPNRRVIATLNNQNRLSIREPVVLLGISAERFTQSIYNNSLNSSTVVTGNLQTNPSHTYAVGCSFFSGRSFNSAGELSDGGYEVAATIVFGLYADRIMLNKSEALSWPASYTMATCFVGP